MPKRISKARREKFNTFENLSILEDHEKLGSKSFHITMNRESILKIGEQLAKICEGLKDPIHFEECVLELEELKDTYMRIGSGSGSL